MSLKPEVRDALKRLGFSEYNITIYETLLREKELDARVLSQKTGVPYSRVYEILNEMIEKNFIMKIDGRPSTYMPRSPIEVLQGIQQEQEDAFLTNSKVVKEPLMNLYSENRSAQNAQVTLTYGKKTNAVHVRNIIKNAVRSLSFILNDFDLFFPEIVEELKLLRLKHVKARLIFPTSEKENLDIAEIATMSEIRFTSVPPITLVIGDEQNAILITAGDYVKKVSEDVIGVNFAHSSMSFILNNLFQNLWDGLS